MTTTAAARDADDRARTVPVPHPLRNSASRESMLRKRVLPIAVFAAEVAMGNGQATKPPLAERLRLYGATIVPIPVPLAPQESEELYEARFVKWLHARGMSLKELATHRDANRERTTRYSYAVDLARTYLDGVRADVKKNDEVEEGEEEEEELEVAAQSTTTVADDVTTIPGELPREVYTTRQVTTLKAYREDVASGAFRRLGAMSSAEKQQRFGLPIVPIAVPLAPGETEQQYEERFATWLAREKQLTLEKLQTHKVRRLERYLRLTFASLNGRGIVRFVAPHTPPVKRPAVAPPSSYYSPMKKPKVLETDDAKPKPMGETTTRDPSIVGEHKRSTCTGGSSVAACVACQCRQCLVRGMTILAARVTAVETRSSCACTERVMDLTNDATESFVARSHDTEMPNTNDVDSETTTMRALQQAYDDVNDEIVMNEQMLTLEEARLENESETTTMDERMQLQQENEELRGMIESEYARRSTAVALLLAFSWRHTPHTLREMCDDPTACYVRYVQRRVHHRCSELAREIAATEGGDGSAKQQELERLRRREMELLVRFDSDVRRGIQHVLAMATSQCDDKDVESRL